MKFAYIFLVLVPFVELIIASSVSSSTASPSALECQLDHFQNGFYENYGNQHATQVPVGRFVTVRCNPGYRLVGDERVQCDADGHLRNQATCEDINECSLVSDDDEGTDYSLVSSDEITTPDIINFPCIESATCVNTHGSFTCQCRHKPIAPCTKFLPCTDVLSPEHGYIVEQSQIHVAFGCKDGYSLKGSEVRRCFQGSWDGEQTQCQVTTCQPPPDIIANGWSDVENRTYTYGEEVHYGCADGFRLVGGNSWRICANNFWTSKTASCQEIQCPDPGQIINGQTLLFSRDIGGEVKFYCESGGFQLLGSPVRVCQPNGKWSGTMTTCNNPGTYCPTPVVPFNGMAIVGSTSLDHPFNGMARESLDHGDVITFTCNYGYDLIGSSQRRCTSTGQWSGEQAVCRAVGEYDDIEDVARRLVETTSLLRDGVQIQRRFTTESIIVDDNNHQIFNSSDKAGHVKAGRLATIPLSEPAGGENRGLDVYFVFDVSKSVKLGQTHIEAIEFAKAFVNKVGVSSTGIGGTRYGAIAYASTAEVMFQLDGDSIDHVHQGLDSIFNLVSKQYLGEGTATSKALKLVHKNMIQHTANAPGLRGKRLHADKVLFLLTDGQSNMHGSPEHEAAILKDRFDVAIHCIGIGNEVNRVELKKVASEPEKEYVFLLQNFATLDELTSAITVTAADYSECGISRGPKNTDEGVMTADDVWPWQAGLYTHIARTGTPVFFCGGTLIAPNWILSAAHCFDPEEESSLPGRDVPQNIIVYMGMNKRIKGNVEVPRRAQIREVKRIITHEHYDSSLKPTYDNDIALLELQTPFDLDAYVRTVCLPPTTNYGSLLAPGDQNKPFATGWGRNRSGDDLSDHLKQIALPIRPSDDKFCRVTEHERHGKLTERMFCAGYSDGRADTCNGDSGGPLVRQWRPPIENASLAMANGNSNELLRWEGKWYQVGIISWGENCAKREHYGYYTNLQHFVTWVENIIS